MKTEFKRQMHASPVKLPSLNEACHLISIAFLGRCNARAQAVARWTGGAKLLLERLTQLPAEHERDFTEQDLVELYNLRDLAKRLLHGDQ